MRDEENRELLSDPLNDSDDINTNEDKLKKQKVIIIVAAVICIPIILFLLLGTGKKEKKENKSEETTITEQNIKLDTLTDEETEILPPLDNNYPATNNNGMYEYNDSNLANSNYSEIPNTYEADTIDNSYASINTQPPDIYSRDTIEQSSSGENSKEKGKKSGIGFKKEGTTAPPVQNQNTTENNNQLQQEKKTDKDKKNEFIGKSKRGDFILGQQLSEPISEYELKAGSIIPITLTSRINSDLPSDIIGLVREDVYNSINGKFLLIPKGSKVYGTYDSNIAYGQDRLLFVWQRIQMPNGFTINLENMQGVDLLGQSGVKGKVNNHTLKLLRSVVLSSLFNFMSNGISVNYSAGNSSGKSDNQIILGNVADDTSSNIQSIGDRIVERDLERQPTVVIKEGTRMNIFVNKDMLLYPYKKLKTVRR